ncbi:SMI1/KNR4 family protein [Nocardia concava]|uniref:SMI1/KNR4 family protein n=1 Tax=Nocardia concava TaxID=257281 RepID=UPI0005929590|nr:SMI1/KNR4 family protein [Nocardia concava]
MTNWKALVGSLYEVQYRAAERIGERGMALPPNRPASDAVVAAAERRLGVRFDRAFRDFLRVCDGWPRFGTIQLYGAADLGAGEKWRRDSTFAEMYFAAEASSALVVPHGYRRVLIGKAAAAQRFIVMVFPTVPGIGPSACWDCTAGMDLPYPDFGAWAELEASAIAYALGEELADRRCLR